MSCAGHPALKTPNIDRIANEGVRFANMFCTTSLCSPSRASILTGVYAHTHGVTNNFTDFPERLTHWPMRLRESGYETAYMGKWHMGEDNDAPRSGFDFFATHKGQGRYFDTEWNINVDSLEAHQGLCRHHHRHRHGARLAGKATTAASRGHSVLAIRRRTASTRPRTNTPMSSTKCACRIPIRAFHLYDKPTWIKERLYTWHGIYGPLFEWRKKFPDDRPEGVKDFENMVHGYWGTILSVDDSVGRMLKYLEDTKQLDHTIVVFMGDNGLLEGEHGMIDKRTAHEASLRIPLLVRYPGLAKGKGRGVEQALTLDVAPEPARTPRRAKPLENIHGKSWAKLVREGDPEWRKAWFYEYNYEKQFPYTPNVRAVRTDEWKYIHYPHGDGTPDQRYRRTLQRQERFRTNASISGRNRSKLRASRN